MPRSLERILRLHGGLSRQGPTRGASERSRVLTRLLKPPLSNTRERDRQEGRTVCCVRGGTGNIEPLPPSHDGTCYDGHNRGHCIGLTTSAV